MLSLTHWCGNEKTPAGLKHTTHFLNAFPRPFEVLQYLGAKNGVESIALDGHIMERTDIVQVSVIPTRFSDTKINGFVLAMRK